LHVRERQADGYHRIETIFAFAEDGDRLRVEPAEDLSLAIEGPFASALSAGEDNLVLRAARRLRERAGVMSGARLVLDKQLPIASGIGGGSADAAAALKLLARWWDIAGEGALQEIAASLGSDVPACLLSRTCRGEGRGDRLSLIDEPRLEGMNLLMVNPRVALSTAAVFASWDGVDRGPLGDYRDGRNDLEASAIRLAPEIADVLGALRDQAPRLARMSGSGATCFALFDGEAARDAAAGRIAAAYPDWWQFASRLR
jgi:4-diphosphocytidyl-2-C-methyl-D-erythritol kinase